MFGRFQVGICVLGRAKHIKHIILTSSSPKRQGSFLDDKLKLPTEFQKAGKKRLFKVSVPSTLESSKSSTSSRQFYEQNGILYVVSGSYRMYFLRCPDLCHYHKIFSQSLSHLKPQRVLLHQHVYTLKENLSKSHQASTHKHLWRIIFESTQLSRQ